MDIDFSAIISEQQIREGIEDGKFENLPGKGKPLDLDKDAHLSPEVRLANSILKNANVLPEWIQLQQDIEVEKADAAAFRARIIKEHARRIGTVSALPEDHAGRRYFAEWCAKSRTAYLKRLKSINTALLKLTLCSPSTLVVSPGYRIEVEMEAFDREFPIPADIKLTDTRGEGLIREVARMKYESGSGTPVTDLLANPRQTGIRQPERIGDGSGPAS
jgi:hypothetical protein